MHYIPYTLIQVEARVENEIESNLNTTEGLRKYSGVWLYSSTVCNVNLYRVLLDDHCVLTGPTVYMKLAKIHLKTKGTTLHPGPHLKG